MPVNVSPPKSNGLLTQVKSFTVKPGQAFPPRFYHSNVGSGSRCRNQYQIQICLPTCVMSWYFFNDSFNVFSQIEISLNGLNCFEDIYSKFEKTELPNYLACEFTAHYACRNAEMNLKSTTKNGFNFRVIHSLMGSWEVRLTWVNCKSTIIRIKPT